MPAVTQATRALKIDLTPSVQSFPVLHNSSGFNRRHFNPAGIIIVIVDSTLSARKEYGTVRKLTMKCLGIIFGLCLSND